jgi:hypothetical protein
MAQPAEVSKATARTLSLMQARMLVIGLEFEKKTGMKMSGKVNSKRIAAEALGLPTRTKIDVLIAGLKEAIRYTEIANEHAQPA